MTRARWISGLALVALGGLTAAALLAPRLVARRAEAAIGSRSGCDVAVLGPVRLGWRDVELGETRLSCSFGDAVLERLIVELGPVEALRGAPPRGIRVEGGHLELRGRPVRGGDQGGGSAAGQGGSSAGGSRADGPSLDVRGLEVRAVAGDLELAVGVVDVTGTSQRLEVTVRGLATSPELRPSVDAEVTTLTVRRDGGVLVDQARFEGLRVRSGEGPALSDAVRGWLGAPPGGAASEPARRRWEVIAEGGTLEVSGGEVLDSDGLALADLNARFERVGGSRFRTSGTGRPRGTGGVSWDLAIDAEHFAADGRIVLDQVPLSVLEPFLPSLPLHQTAQTRVAADLWATTRDGEEIELRGSAAVDGLALANPRIASAPVTGIDLRVVGSASWDRPRHTVRVSDGEIVLGGARARIAGSGMFHEGRYLLDLEGELPTTPCDVAVHAIPAGLLQELAAMRLEGTFAGRVRARVDSEHLDDSVLRIDVTDRCRFVEVPPMAAVTRFQAPFLHQVLEPDDTTFEMETGPGTAAWTPIREISPFLVHSVLAHEDASFFTHSGFAPWAIRDALVRNLRERRYVLGASTITMQLVKNVFLRREKTLARKVQEVLLTWWVESAMTKEQILELYLNVIEYGPQVYGIRNAAAHYFARSPSELSVAESAYLAMILPNPPMFHEHYEAGEVPPPFRRRTERFVTLLHERGRIDAEATQQGLDELSQLRFARDGDVVGPEVLQGTAARLPIEGFSGFPGGVTIDSAEDTTDGFVEESPQGDGDGWEEVWP